MKCEKCGARCLHEESRVLELQVDAMRAVVKAGRELIGKNVTRPYVYQSTDSGKYKLALALQALDSAAERIRKS
jgi:hypothetical protein